MASASILPCVVMQHHQGQRTLAPALALDRDHGAFADRRMLRDQILDIE